MSDSPESPGEISAGEPAETSAEPSTEAKRRLKTVVGGAIAFVIAALIGIALLFSSSKSGDECDPWLKAKTDYLKQVPPIQQETQSDLIDFEGKVVVGGKTFTRPDACK